MLKLEKRHSQTLSTKKPKPIEITLTKKAHQLQGNTTPNHGEDTLNHSIDKSYREGLSLIRPLKQKTMNLPEPHTLDLKSLKSKQQKLKQQVCPSYKINWGSTPTNNNSSRFSQFSSLMASQELPTFQLSHLVKTNEYKKYTRQVHDKQYSNLPQFQMVGEKKLEVIKEQQPIMDRDVKQGSSMNSVKSKIKGITKGFLRNEKLSEKLLQNEEIKNSSEEVLATLNLNQQSLIEVSVVKTDQEPSILRIESQALLTERPIPQPLPSQPVSMVSIEQPSSEQLMTERSALKQHYAELEVRLEQCVEQIVEIERNNNVEKIVELQNQIHQIKMIHEQEKTQMKNRIHELQAKLAQKQQNQKESTLKIQTKSLQMSIKNCAVNTLIRPTSNIVRVEASKIELYQKQISNLRQKVAHLNESLQNQSMTHLDASFTHHSARSSLEIQSQIYDNDMIKRKQSTLEQVLDLKKKEILNKDSIIQMLLSKEVEKVILNGPSFPKNDSEKKDQIKAIVFEMIGYMNGKLSAL